LNKLEEAIQSYEKAIELNSDYADAWKNMGNTLLKLGKNWEAGCCLRVARQIESGFTPDGE
jgi:tetratricopeptide (TPR) repeat protein